MSTIVITIDTDAGTARINRKPVNLNGGNAQLSLVAPAKALPPAAYSRRQNKNDRKTVNHRKPLIKHPVAFVRNWLNDHPGLERKDAVAQLIDLGINKATARTQYHHWVKANEVIE